MCGCGLFHQFPTGLLTSLEGSGTPRQWRAPLDGSAILLQSLCYHNLCVIGRGVIVVNDECSTVCLLMFERKWNDEIRYSLTIRSNSPNMLVMSMGLNSSLDV